jgi:hypothetical protein
MKIFEDITEENFDLFAAHYYDNPQCENAAEFYDDLKRFKYLKRLFNRYLNYGDLQERLILNHLIVLYNVFGITPANQMMFHKMEVEYWSTLKTFLVYLNYIPLEDKVDIPLDQEIVEKLRKL